MEYSHFIAACCVVSMVPCRRESTLNAEEEKFEFGTSVKCHVWLGSGETETESDQLDPPDLVRFVALATTRDWSFQL